MPEWLTRKYGPLAAWQWAALGAGGFVVYRWWKNRQAAASSSSSTGAATTAAGTTTPSYSPPTATVSLPGGGSYSGPAGGLSSVLGQLQPTSSAPSDQITFSTPGGATYSGPSGSVPSALLGGSPAASPGAPATGTSAPSVGAFTVGGFGPTAAQAAGQSSGGYYYVQTPQQAATIGPSNLFFEPAAGVFQPAYPSGGAGVPGGTPLYARTS